MLPGLLLLAALLRLTVLEHYAIQLDRDIDLYQPMAAAIRDGRGFIHPETGLPTAYRPPLYPVVLSLVIRPPSWISSLKAERGPLDNSDEMPMPWSGTAIGVLHILLSVATVGLTYLTGRRLGLGKWAWLAAGLVSVDPLLLYSVSQVMTETLATFLAAGTLCWLARTAPLPESGILPRRSVLSALVLGLLFGLCGLCRPTFYAWGVVLVVGWAVAVELRFWRRAEGAAVSDPRPWYTFFATLAVPFGFVLAVSPWVMRNISEFNKPILSTTHGGYTLLLGHNLVYYDEVVRKPWGTVWSGQSLRAWQQSVEKEMVAEKPRPRRDEVARDKWMHDKALELIVDDPWMAVRAGLTLLGRMWNVMPLETPGRPRQLLRYITGGCYAVWFCAMIIGLFRLPRRDWSSWWPSLALLLSCTAVHFFYWADLRMRAPLVPVMALLAARAFQKSPRPIPALAAIGSVPAGTQSVLAAPIRK